MPVAKKNSTIDARLSALGNAAESMAIPLVPTVRPPKPPPTPLSLGEGVTWPHMNGDVPDWSSATLNKTGIVLTSATLAGALRNTDGSAIDGAIAWCKVVRARRIEKASAILAEPEEANALVEMNGEMGLLLLEDLKEEE